MTAAAATSRSFVLEREIFHPPEKVWRALTQKPLITDWLMNNDFEPVVGRKFTLRGTPMPHWDGVVECEVLSVEPQRRLSYKWDAMGGQLKTVVTWTLTPTSGGTLVRVEQAGFENETYHRGAASGWSRHLAALERVVAALA